MDPTELPPDQVTVLSETIDGLPAIVAPTAAAWRAWLDAHAATEPGVWLVMGRADSATPLVSYDDAVCQALCVGWIDSVVRRRDDETRYQRYTPRNPRSAWARSNRERVARLTAAGLMAPAGQALVDQAKASGTWDLLAEVEDGIVPADVQAALDELPAAAEHFAAFPPSARLQILTWILTAKRPETRARRIVTTVAKAAKGERAVG
ncbi:YdeI family protein [Iamia sp. SCSIO 61187]|uniref:YdeI/OmpD-associated family protein n=1 Tax=Iamia sp. SCSIO 61187 TaxID=2722752 RepID=UPI001C62A555|nr:YdeI/OmpD-associated family protein [Iamia sp. SCSIO 61187]